MNGHATFNEVFFTDARVPHANLVGAPGDGWRVAVTTLAHERGAVTGRRPRYPKEVLASRTVQEAKAESDEYYKTYEWYPQRAGRPDLAPVQAEAMGRDADPVVRQHLAGVRDLELTTRWSAQRAAAARSQGRPPGPEGSLAKLNASRIARTAARVHGEIAGAHGLLAGPDTPVGGVVAEVLVSVPGQSIAGGTDEIQHNIIGERVLGLPKEPQVDADMPFREVRTNTYRG
jgi:alkylation response protein AidB-like acyl-CoA dehydrogenase